MNENETAKNLARRAKIKADFFARGVSVADWAREHGLSPQKVYDLLNGRTAGARGEAHRAAVLLGLKEGVIEKSA